MKRIAVAPIVLAACLVLASCAAPAASFSNPRVTELTFTASDDLAVMTNGLPDKFDGIKDQVMGFSPDGRKAVLLKMSSGVQYFSITSATDENEPTATEEIRSSFMASRKHPVWSKDGKTFLFADNSLISIELQYLFVTNAYVFKTENGSLTCVKATDNDASKTYASGGSQVYAETFSADEKSVVYAKRTNGVWEVCKSGIESRKETVLLKEDGDGSGSSAISDALELKPNLLFCTIVNSPKPDTLFFYDCARSKRIDISNDALALPDKFSYFDLKGWSGDRRTLLVAAWCQYTAKEAGEYNSRQQIKALYLFRFDAGFTGMGIQKIDMGGAADDRYCENAALSADGKYIASYEMTKGGMKSQEAVLYSLDARRRGVLKAVKSPWLFTGSVMNGNPQTFFFTNDKRLIVSYADSWKVYALK